MSRQLNRLEASFLRSTALPIGRHADGGGLYLQVTESKSADRVGERNAVWVFRYVGADKREHWQGLGGFPTVSLADARNRATDARRTLAAMCADPENMCDPLAERRAARANAAKHAAQNKLFSVAVADYLKNKSATLSAGYLRNVENMLRKYAIPMIGNTPILEIDLALVRQILDPIWYVKTATAGKLREHIESVLNLAFVGMSPKPDNPAAWADHLDSVYPTRDKIKGQEVKSMKSMPHAELPAFFAELRKHETPAARALQWAILHAARPNEACRVRHEHVESDVCTIPADMMKAKKEHRFPLTATARTLIDGRKVGPLFTVSGNPLAQDTVLKFLRNTMGVAAYDVHGFRHCFRNFVRDMGLDEKLAEMQLAHAAGKGETKVERAYATSDALERRRELLDVWHRYVLTGELPAAKVVPMRRAG
jgi:integrase